MKMLFLGIILFFQSTLSFANQSLSFGIVPQQSASKLLKLWGPIITQISESSGIDIHFSTAPDIPTFEKRLAEGEYDIAYMNPYHYVIFHDAVNYQAIAKASNKKIKGILVVPHDSKIDSLQALQKATLAFPAPAAFAATILPQSELAKQGVQFKTQYVSSHDSVYRAVAKGIFPAGGGVIRTFDNMPDDIKSQLKILWTTKGYTPHAIATHPTLNKQLQKKIQQAITELTNTPEGVLSLKQINIKAFESAKNSDWNDIRDLNIQLLR